MASRSSAEVDDLHFAPTPAEVEELRRRRGPRGERFRP